MGLEFNILFYSTLAGLSTILGVVLVIFREKWVLRYSHYVNSFAAGLILGLAFFHLFPESLELSDNALLFIFMGFLLFYLLESVMVIHSGSEIHFFSSDELNKKRGYPEDVYCGGFGYSIGSFDFTYFYW